MIQSKLKCMIVYNFILVTLNVYVLINISVYARYNFTSRMASNELQQLVIYTEINTWTNNYIDFCSQLLYNNKIRNEFLHGAILKLRKHS